MRNGSWDRMSCAFQTGQESVLNVNQVLGVCGPLPWTPRVLGTQVIRVKVVVDFLRVN